MGGMWTLACLLVAAGGAPADLVPLNNRAILIPVQVQPAARPAIKELILWVSEDQGHTWQQLASASPDKEGITFNAPDDGEYWFGLVVVDQQGKQQPPDIYKAKPRQKILIDTIKPIVSITAAERQGEDVVVSWQIQEKNPDLATLKLEYRLADGQASSLWYAVPLNAATTGQTKFRMPNPAAAIQLRMEIKDLAGNIGTAEKEVAAAPAGGPAPHWDTQGSSTGAPVVTALAPVTKTLPVTAPNPTNGMAAPGSPWEQQAPVSNPTLVRPEFPQVPHPPVPPAPSTDEQQANRPTAGGGHRLLASAR